MTKTVISTAAILCSLLAILLLRTAYYGHRQTSFYSENSAVRLDVAAAVERLSNAIQIRTISDGATTPALLQFHAFLGAAFPRVHAALSREIVNKYSLLYTWRGDQPDLKPILLMAHMDVVPIDPGSDSKWTYPPFSGRIANGFVWGRGAMDDKAGVMAILEAVERLLAVGFRPRRTVYLAFGHDEERGGNNGAAKIAALLASRKIEMEFVLDEGGNITDEIIPGVDRPVALIGIAEKGYASLELKVQTAGGHSSMPPARTAIGILAGALYKLETTPFPARLSQPIRKFFEYIGPAMKWPARMAIANMWLFEPWIRRKLEESPLTSALIRNTQASTIFQSGIRENVLPTQARAVVNFRILPGDTTADIENHVRAAIDDARVQITLLGLPVEPSPMADPDSPGFRAIGAAVTAGAPGTIVAPFLLVGATDSRYYVALTQNIFRFLPIMLRAEDARRYHGTDERIAVEDYERCMAFYVRLIRNSQP